MKRLQTLALSVIFFLLASGAQALTKQPFNEALFSELKSKGEVILIDVYASWCSTCVKQQSALKAYIKANPDKKIHILEVDYDKDKKIVRQLRAPRQSTLLLYKGDKQFWFSVAESRPDVIAAEIDKALNFKAKS